MSGSGIWSLLLEPDNLATVFLQLGLDDLVSAELVCRTWREFIVGQRIWRRRLLEEEKKKSIEAKSLIHLGGVPAEHKDAKKMCFFLSSTILPDSGQDYIGLQSLYRRSRIADQQTIFADIPRLSLHNPANVFIMSKLLVFGPSAFPLLTAPDDSVVIAGAHYGRGRVVVLPHERLLEDKPLMTSLAAWVARSRGQLNIDFYVSADPVSKAGRLWRHVNPWHRLTRPFDSMLMAGRDKLSQYQTHHPGPHVYITEGHYDDHADQVIAFVRNGGGLIIAGHAWFWASQQGDQQSVLLNHPGNKITTHFGIAFSGEPVDERVVRSAVLTRYGSTHLRSVMSSLICICFDEPKHN